LVPVLRGTVPVTGSGPILITGAAGDRTVFGTIVRLTLAGSDRAAAAGRPESHVLRGNHFVLLSSQIAAILGDHALPDRGGAGGLAIYRLTREEGTAIEGALRAEGENPGRIDLPFHSGLEVRTNISRYQLRFRSEFRYGDYSYSSRFILGSRPGGDGQNFVHGESDAERPGYSRAGVLAAIAVHE
jgi:hypothetical protein